MHEPHPHTHMNRHGAYLHAVRLSRLHAWDDVARRVVWVSGGGGGGGVSTLNFYHAGGKASQDGPQAAGGAGFGASTRHTAWHGAARQPHAALGHFYAHLHTRARREGGGEGRRGKTGQASRRLVAAARRVVHADNFPFVVCVACRRPRDQTSLFYIAITTTTIPIPGLHRGHKRLLLASTALAACRPSPP